jgi:hypothetical protein
VRWAKGQHPRPRQDSPHPLEEGPIGCEGLKSPPGGPGGSDCRHGGLDRVELAWGEYGTWLVLEVQVPYKLAGENEVPKEKHV